MLLTLLLASESPSMSHKYVKQFFTDDQIQTIFDNAQNSMEKIHEEQGPYAHIANFLRTELGMRDPLCVQTFYVGQGYEVATAHIDIATAMYPSITNLWFSADDCAGESFGFFEMENNEAAYKDWMTALSEGAVADFESLCDDKYFGEYTAVKDYKKGDALFFDSRQVHRKMNETPRKTLVFKYINSEDLDDRTPINYERIPGGPDWVRILIFDHLRFVDGHEARKKFIRDTERLLASMKVAPPAKQSPIKRVLRKLGLK
jgi:hypothetical protein